MGYGGRAATPAQPHDRVQQRRLLAGDIGAGAREDLDLEVHWTMDVVAHIARGSGLGNGGAQRSRARGYSDRT